MNVEFKVNQQRICGWRGFRAAMLMALGLAWLATPALKAGALYVPNNSFESPTTMFADPSIGSWQKADKPGWYPDYSDQRNWTNLAGVFLNTAPGSSDHIDNCAGAQGVFLFAVPQMALFQEMRQPATSNSPAYDAKFQAGRAYQLRLGVIGGGGGMTNGVSLRTSLYYLDANTNKVAVSSLVISNEISVFSNTTHFVEFTLTTPTIRAGDAWTGKTIGIEFLSAADFGNQGGYWDLDNVRLSEIIEVPNGSFESPTTLFADPSIGSWQKADKPGWYPDYSDQRNWTNLAGVFLNTAAGTPDHIDNCVGAQGAFLFAVPQMALFQEVRLPASGNSPAMAATYETGNAYQFSLGVIGGGGGMTNGVSLRASLYYLDAATNRVAVVSSNIVYTAQTFSNTTHFVDFTLKSPAVKAQDPWAGKVIGVEILSTADFGNQGGYWDLDNVQLATIQDPVQQQVQAANGQFGFVIASEPGQRLEVLGSAAVAAPPSQWTSLGVVTNTTGKVIFSTPMLEPKRWFFQTRQLP